MIETLFWPPPLSVGLLNSGVWKVKLDQNWFLIQEGQHFALVLLCHVSDHKDCLCQSLYLNNRLLSAARKYLLEYTAGFMHSIRGFSTLVDKLYMKILLNNWRKCRYKLYVVKKHCNYMQCLFPMEEIIARLAFFMLISRVFCGSVFLNSSKTNQMSELCVAIRRRGRFCNELSDINLHHVRKSKWDLDLIYFFWQIFVYKLLTQTKSKTKPNPNKPQTKQRWVLWFNPI